MTQKFCCEAAIRMLRNGEEDEGPKRGCGVARGEERRGAVHHVARPDQVIASFVVITLRLPPRDGKGCDQRTGKRFVFMCEQQRTTAVV